MSYKTVLVQANADKSGSRALRVAKTVAEMFQASLLGVAAAGFDPTVYGDAAGELITAEREQIEAAIASARDSFQAQSKAWPFGAQCVSSGDFPSNVMLRHARGADLIVAARPPAHSTAGFTCNPTDLVMQSGLPVLLAADGDAKFSGERVLVAWRDQREAIRAVSAALPFLIQAHSVHLVSICPPEQADEARDGLAEVGRRLTRHGATVETEILEPKGSATGDLEAAAEHHGADLIVAGAFSHNRLREWVLGGVTQDLIAGSAKFVLFSR